MTLQATDPIYYPHPYFAGNDAAAFASASAINDAADRVALIFQANFADSIDQIAVCFATITTPETLDFRVETVGTATNSVPSGTLWATNTAATNITATAATVVAGTLTANASIAKGDRVAIVIQERSGGGAINLGVNRVNPDAVTAGGWVGPAGNFPYGSFNLTGTYANSAAMPVVGVHLVTANKWVCVSGAIPLVQSFTTSAFNTGTGASTGTRRGLYLQVPFTATLQGLWMKAQTTSSADFDVVLYDITNATITTLFTAFDSSQQRAQAAVGVWELYFTSTFNLVAGLDYRLVIQPTTANSVTLSELVFNAAGHLGTMVGGTSMYLTKFVSSAWAEETAQRPLMGLILGGLDDGAGAGGGLLRPVGMRGGLV